MAKRYLVLCIPSLLLPCFLIIDAEEAVPPSSLSISNCSDRCGTVTIPFPYGMGRSDCFLNPWFEIECRNQTTPFLKNIDWQVLNISFPTRRNGWNSDEHTITVNFPIRYSNPNYCTTKRNSTQILRLKGSPFSFSTVHNYFIAVGCDVNVFLSWRYVSLGCKVECGGGNFSRYSTCSGSDSCCLATIPYDLQTFTVDFNATGMNSNQQCNYASLIEAEWLDSQSIDLEFLEMEGYVPVVMNWGIPNDTHVKQHDTNVSAGLNPPSDCHTASSSESFLSKYHLKHCTCNFGYQGNPYMDYGCEDIDECFEQPQLCSSYGGWCKNTMGSYDCVHTEQRRTLKSVMIGVGSGIGALLLVLIGWWSYKIINKRKEALLKQKYFKRNGGPLLQQQVSLQDGNGHVGKLFNQKELQMATENFSESRVVGKGGQGTVYKGMLIDGKIVAIKKALAINERKVEQFINEVMILSKINHRNIVKLLGFCLETEFPLLIYEFIPNGTLYEYLHESNKDVYMSWEVRLQLSKEIAGALFYLHSLASAPIYHRDIKSTNILLDEKYQAKIADFGTSRLISLDQTHVTTKVQGTFGYFDPEFFLTNQFTDKSDVYSFGVVLVELLTGQKPVSKFSSDECRSLSTYFVHSMEEGHLFDILDPQFEKQGREEEILIVANIAKRCLNMNGRNRPTMKEVVIELEGIEKFRQLPDLQGNEDNCKTIQYQNISRSASTRLEVDTNINAISDVDPLLFGHTWR